MVIVVGIGAHTLLGPCGLRVLFLRLPMVRYEYPGFETFKKKESRILNIDMLGRMPSTVLRALLPDDTAMFVATYSL
jgi:hypothetical protein